MSALAEAEAEGSLPSARPPASRTPLLEGVNLSKHFGGGGLFRPQKPVRAVDGVSLRVMPGETFAIVGESGCGKSTLARLLLRLHEPTAGDVIFEGRNVTALRGEPLRALRRDMQMIFQDPFGSLNPRMSVGDLVAEPLAVHGLASGRAREAKVAEILGLVGLLPEQAGRFPHEFSGGQRQRIGIARALAAGPKLVIGDEPVSALDVSVRAQILNLLEDLKARLGLTLVLVSHDLAVVRHASDRVAVMYLGRIVETAPARELFERPAHPYTRALMAAIPVPEPPRAGRRAPPPLLEGDPPSPANPPPGCRFHTRCPRAEAICRTVDPPEIAVGRGPDASAHWAACHFAAEVVQGPSPIAEREGASAARLRRIALFAAAGSARAPASIPTSAPA